MEVKKAHVVHCQRKPQEGNPEKTQQQRTEREVKHLEELGFTVIPPKRKQPEEMTLEELESHLTREQKARQEYMRNYVARNRERLRQYQREYKRTHKIKIDPAKQKEYVKRWKAKHAEEVREYQRKWKADHAEQVKGYRRKWLEKNPDYYKQRNDRFKSAYKKALEERQLNTVITDKAFKTGEEEKV